MKRLLTATAIGLGLLTGNSYAMDFSSMPEGVKIGTVSLLMVSSAACKTELSPFSIDLLKALAPDVDSKDVRSANNKIIRSWKTRQDKAKWCASAAKGLKDLEVKFASDAETKKAAAEKPVADDTAAIALGLLTGAAHAAPSCHQKMVLAKTEYNQEAYPVAQKVLKMIRAEALNLISATSDIDVAVMGKAYVDAVATATVNVLNASITDDIKVMLSQMTNTMVRSISDYNKNIKDPVSANELKSGTMSLATQDIVTAFLACK